MDSRHYDLQMKALDAIRENRMLFAQKMEASLLLNTTIINKRLHHSTRQTIEKTYEKRGNFYANCELMDQLERFDSGGEVLLRAFSEINYKGQLASILRRALNPTHVSSDSARPSVRRYNSEGYNTISVSSSTSSPVTRYHSVPKGCNTISVSPSTSSPRTPEPLVQLTFAVQETRSGHIKTDLPQASLPGGRTNLATQPLENQFTELTSAQQDIVNSCSTSCNVTPQRPGDGATNHNVNKVQSAAYKEDISKYMQPFIQNDAQAPEREAETETSTTETTGVSSVVESMSEYSSDTMSDSFVISDSEIRQAFNPDENQNNVVPEIENLKLCDVAEGDGAQNVLQCDVRPHNLNSHTFVKQEFCTNRNGAESSNSQTFPKELRRDEDEQNTICSLEYTSANFIDVHPSNNKTMKEGNPFQTDNDDSHSDDNDDDQSTRNPQCGGVIHFDEISCDEVTNNLDVDKMSSADTITDMPRNSSTQEADFTSMPTIGRFQSCPPIGSGSHNETSIDGNDGRGSSLDRALSVPVEGTNFLFFNNVFKKCRYSACKGISGNL